MLISWLRKVFGLGGASFTANSELDQVIRQIALIRRRATGFDPEEPAPSSAEAVTLLKEMEESIMPRLKELAAYLAPYMSRNDVHNWRADPDIDWCRWFVAGEVKRLSINRQ